ncbi:MAG: hypothetical protein CL927_04665 [Deltaproteobacteria bacterium]|nr:hypothetical protein [Deltaproteobacteria bacterium]
MTSLLVALALSATTADAKPYMWGAGGSVNTMILPGGYPSTWAKAKRVDGTIPNLAPYTNDNGSLAAPHFNEVRGDLGVGARGLFYINGTWRGRASGQMAFGSDYRGGHLVMGIDKIVGGESGASLLVGGDFLGIGFQRFSSAEDGAELRASTFPVRGHLGLMYKINKTSAIELSPFVALPLPLRQMLTTDAGEEHEMGVGLNPLQYGSIGIELSYYYGDFSKPSRKGKKGKKGKKGRR